jgi:2-haloalkanoic acid dehalogenase type II
MTYSRVLKASYGGLVREVGALPAPSSSGSSTEDVVDALLDAESTAVAGSIAVWPPFPDTIAAMRKLKARGYKLVPLSNVDRASFNKTLHGPLSGLHDEDPSAFFDAIYTAQDIGSYKPDLRNFEYLLEHVARDLGIDLKKEQVLHVAQSLFHDHEPAKKMGLHSVWIARGKGGVSGMRGWRLVGGFRIWLAWWRRWRERKRRRLGRHET